MIVCLGGVKRCLMMFLSVNESFQDLVVAADT